MNIPVIVAGAFGAISAFFAAFASSKADGSQTFVRGRFVAAAFVLVGGGVTSLLNWSAMPQFPNANIADMTGAYFVWAIGTYGGVVALVSAAILVEAYFISGKTNAPRFALPLVTTFLVEGWEPYLLQRKEMIASADVQRLEQARASGELMTRLTADVLRQIAHPEPGRRTEIVQSLLQAVCAIVLERASAEKPTISANYMKLIAFPGKDHPGLRFADDDPSFYTHALELKDRFSDAPWGSHHHSGP